MLTEQFEHWIRTLSDEEISPQDMTDKELADAWHRIKGKQTRLYMQYWVAPVDEAEQVAVYERLVAIEREMANRQHRITQKPIRGT